MQYEMHNKEPGTVLFNNVRFNAARSTFEELS
jgi:hypothetical protein